MGALRGRALRACAKPTYVLDIPGGHGKVPVGPSYLDGEIVSDPRRIAPHRWILRALNFSAPIPYGTAVATPF